MEQTKLFCGRSAKLPPRREQQGFTRTSEPVCERDNKIVPAQSVKDYNKVVVNCAPRSVHGMKVFF